MKKTHSWHLVASSRRVTAIVSASNSHRLRRRLASSSATARRSTTPRSSCTGDRITQVGPAASVKAPAGATRVSLTGKTVMPAIVDSHVHTSTTAAELETDLQRRARFGVSAALSIGLDGTDAAFAQRDKTVPTLARIFTAGRGITAPEKGRTEVPFWITTPDEGRKAVAGARREEGRHHQDLGRRSRRQVPEADAAALQRGDR